MHYLWDHKSLKKLFKKATEIQNVLTEGEDEEKEGSFNDTVDSTFQSCFYW